MNTTRRSSIERVVFLTLTMLLGIGGIAYSIVVFPSVTAFDIEIGERFVIDVAPTEQGDRAFGRRIPPSRDYRQHRYQARQLHQSNPAVSWADDPRCNSDNV
jgi:hypothetical protein